MGYSIIFSVVVGLFGNCLLTELIHGSHTFTGPKALPWELNVCGSPFECLGLALTVVLLFGNIHGQRFKHTTTARITPTTLAPITPTTTTTTTTPATVCPERYSLYSEECGRFCYRYEFSMQMGWSDARKVCQDEGGDLFAPSECIFPFVRELARRNSGGRCAVSSWLGALKLAEKENFRTVRGEQIPNNATFWRRGRPDQKSDENCLKIDNNDYMAIDEYCFVKLCYICQRI